MYCRIDHSRLVHWQFILIRTSFCHSDQSDIADFSRVVFGDAPIGVHRAHASRQSGGWNGFFGRTDIHQTRIEFVSSVDSGMHNGGGRWNPGFLVGCIPGVKEIYATGCYWWCCVDRCLPGQLHFFDIPLIDCCSWVGWASKNNTSMDLGSDHCKQEKWVSSARPQCCWSDLHHGQRSCLCSLQLY